MTGKMTPIQVLNVERPEIAERPIITTSRNQRKGTQANTNRSINISPVRAEISIAEASTCMKVARGGKEKRISRGASIKYEHATISAMSKRVAQPLHAI